MRTLAKLTQLLILGSPIFSCTSGYYFASAALACQTQCRHTYQNLPVKSCSNHLDQTALFSQLGQINEEILSDDQYVPTKKLRRRSFLRLAIITRGTVATAVGAVTMPPGVAIAQASTTPPDGNKPRAPLEALLPAARVKILIDEASRAATELARLGKTLAEDGDRSARKDDLLATLDRLLLEDQSFITDAEVQLVEDQRVKSGGSNWAAWSASRRAQSPMQFSDAASDSPVVRAAEAFQRSGERDQWQRLRRRERAREKGDAMRAAFNFYTSNLIFGESYMVNAGKEERSRLIRTYDQLPDATTVIRSDLDLRDLYRNEILTKMADAKAEWMYQRLNLDVEPQVEDLVELIDEAKAACSMWFGFIPDNDVKEAVAVVAQNIKEELPITPLVS